MATVFRWTGHFPEKTRSLVRGLAQARRSAEAGLSAQRRGRSARQRHDARHVARDELRASRRVFSRDDGADPLLREAPPRTIPAKIAGGEPSRSGTGDALARSGRRGARLLAALLRAAAVLPALDGKLGDAVDELRIRDAVRRGRGRELAVLLEIAARVDLDHVDLARFREPQVDAAVVADAQRAVGVDRRFLQLGLELGLDRRDDGLGAVIALARSRRTSPRCP